MNALSTQLPNEWLKPRGSIDGISLMDHLFNRLDGAYPGRWRSAFPQPESIKNWREAWSEEFDAQGISPKEIKTGISACNRLYDWPPSLKEFVLACRPDASCDAFRAAQVLCSQPVDGRDYGESVMYWSIQRYGESELRTAAWDRAKERWQRIYAACRDEHFRGLLPIIPERRASALPAPGGTSISAEEAARRIKALNLAFNPIGDKAWAQRIVDRAAKGEAVPMVAEKSAREALAEAA